MKRIIICLLFLFSTGACLAGHIAGGEVFYKYLRPGASANSSVYEISLRLFRECSAGGPNVAAMPTDVNLNIYRNTSPSLIILSQYNVTRTSFQTLSLSSPNPCITPAPSICYQVGVFTFTYELPNTAEGYLVVFQTCCRTTGIANIQTFTFANAGGGTTNGEGATYTGNIPGTNTVPIGTTNSSPVFALKDTTVVCQNSPFTLDFSANDPDTGDSLSYTLCAAYDRGTTTAAADPNYSSPPYNAVTYSAGFTGSTPLGPNVTIDPVTGIISGISPDAGRYVVTVCITEWRNGKPISTHRKDFTLIISACTLTGALLKPTYITCNGTTLTFQNESTNSNITSYFWDFGVKNITTDTSSSPTPSYDYLKSGKDSGTYTVQLNVASAAGCKDSAKATVKVYPGFKPGFSVSGSCVLNSYSFSDTSFSRYGVVNSRSWDFGDVTTLRDTAHAKDTAWKYPATGNVQVQLIVGNSYGCVDTVTKSVPILSSPSLNLPFKDTLICSIDTLMLRANISSGTIAWTASNGPNKTRILNTTTATPLVYPQDTTRYYVTVNDNGCSNTDSVTVNVLKYITVKAVDTAICLTDTFRLRVISDALSYQWSSSTGEKVDAVKFPLVRPLVNTDYYVTANLGKCQAKDTLQTIVQPYPNSNAGSDVTICYGSRVQLRGTYTGANFSWSPTASLINANTLTPIAGPTRTTMYVLTANNSIGCLKPKNDTVIVTVIAPIIANAGKDTFAVPGQSLQLEASGGTNYSWSPTVGLSNPFISNPVLTVDNTFDTLTVYKVRVTNAGCFADDEIKIKVFKTGPDILVPSAFTPNGDGRNDVIRPILLGITKLTFFSIYNRWGQLVFYTTEENKGWDGNFAGTAQPSGAYVYVAAGLDYNGKTILRKGTVALIR